MRGVPLFSPEAWRLLNDPAASFREHPDYYRDDPPEDPEDVDYMEWLAELPEAWQAENRREP